LFLMIVSQQAQGRKANSGQEVVTPDLAAVSAPALPPGSTEELALVYHMAGEALVEFGLCNTALAASISDKAESKNKKATTHVEADKKASELKDNRLQRRRLRLAALDAFRHSVSLVPLDRRASALMPLGDLLLDLALLPEAEAAFGDAVVLCAAAAEPPAVRAKQAAKAAAKAAKAAAKAKEKAKQRNNNGGHSGGSAAVGADDPMKMFTSGVQNLQLTWGSALGGSDSNSLEQKTEDEDDDDDDADDEEEENEEDDENNEDDLKTDITAEFDNVEKNAQKGSVASVSANAGAAAAAAALPRAYCGLADALAARGLHAAAATCFYACIGLKQVTPQAAIGVHRRLARLLLDTPASAFGGARLGGGSGSGGKGKGKGRLIHDEPLLDPEEAAARTMKRAASLVPRDVRLQLEYGAVLLRTARFADARRTFRTSLRLLKYSGSVDPEATSPSEDNAASAAGATAADVLAEKAVVPLADHELGHTSEDGIDEDDASSVRSELQGQALLGLGRAVDGLGFVGEAERLFFKAAALTRRNNDRALAGASLGLARLRQGRVEEALEALEDATKRSVGNPEAWLLLGQARLTAALAAAAAAGAKQHEFTTDAEVAGAEYAKANQEGVNPYEKTRAGCVSKTAAAEVLEPLVTATKVAPANAEARLLLGSAIVDLLEAVHPDDLAEMRESANKSRKRQGPSAVATDLFKNSNAALASSPPSSSSTALTAKGGSGTAAGLVNSFASGLLNMAPATPLLGSSSSNKNGGGQGGGASNTDLRLLLPDADYEEDEDQNEDSDEDGHDDEEDEIAGADGQGMKKEDSEVGEALLPSSSSASTKFVLGGGETIVSWLSDGRAIRELRSAARLARGVTTFDASQATSAATEFAAQTSAVGAGAVAGEGAKRVAQSVVAGVKPASYQLYGSHAAVRFAAFCRLGKFICWG
jgi:tetratricopeptide (TPR) repeat protein